MNKRVLSLDLNSKRVEEFLRSDGSVPDRRCKNAEGMLPERFDVTLWDFEELLTR